MPPLSVRFTVLAGVLLLVAVPGMRVRADDGTPTSVVQTIAPTAPTAPAVEATLAPTPTLEPSPLPFPTAQQERSTPIVTSAPFATEGPPSQAGSVEGTPPPAATDTAVPEAGPTFGPPPDPAPTAPVEAPLPSPAELELDARLRWGERVPSDVRRWAFIIVPAAHRYHLDPNLIAAVMTMESDGDPLAWNSGSDARGLMQVLHGPWNPRANIYTGARMLAGFLEQFQDLSLALAAYNAGPGAVLSYNGIPPYRETRDYVIVVRYLFDLFGHHHLNLRRKLQYRRTLTDLRHFARERKRVAQLARIAHVEVAPPAACHHFSTTCGETGAPLLFQKADPFWPLDDAPDPLQQVGPSGLGG